MEIVEIVNRERDADGFDPLIRKLNRQIDQRSRFVMRDGKLVEEIDNERQTVDLVESEWQTPVGQRMLSGNVSTMLSPESSIINKQTRISNVADKLNELTDFVKNRRARQLVQKFESLENLLDKLGQQKYKDSFTKLLRELSEQRMELVSRKAVKPNYATMIKFLNMNLRDAIDKSDILIMKLARRSAFEEMKASLYEDRIVDIKSAIVTRSCFERLKSNADQAKTERLQDKTTQFMIKLDTYLLLLKFNAFFKIGRAHV